MPELPEVETTKEGIKPYLLNQCIQEIIVRNARLRIPVATNSQEMYRGKTIKAVSRRAKYLIIELSQGYILIHLGMSGHLRVLPTNSAAKKHDHIDLCLVNGSILRYSDPRRFGIFHYLSTNPEQSPLLTHLGPEPLSDEFNATYLHQKISNKKQAIKSLIMNNQVVVGIGNIYATESLFLAGIHPCTPAQKIALHQCVSLTHHIKSVLQQAITAGGTTLRDFYNFEGKPGYFNLSLQVYGRKKQSCYHCHHLIDTVLIAGRHSAFCPQCQPPDPH